MEQLFSTDLHFVLEGAQINPSDTSQVVFGDARNLSQAVDGPFDLIITSPPNVNRMSYIREPQPCMYWLGFLANGRDAGELDWSVIGGTWGIATSRLLDWKQPAESYHHPLLDNALNKIARGHHKYETLLS